MKDINWFKESQGIILGALLMTIIMIVCDATPFSINHKWRREAIDRGFAKWVVDAEGDATFIWNEPPVALPIVPTYTESNADTTEMLLFPDPLLPK